MDDGCCGLHLCCAVPPEMVVLCMTLLCRAAPPEMVVLWMTLLCCAVPPEMVVLWMTLLCCAVPPDRVPDVRNEVRAVPLAAAAGAPGRRARLPPTLHRDAPPYSADGGGHGSAYSLRCSSGESPPCTMLS